MSSLVTGSKIPDEVAVFVEEESRCPEGRTTLPSLAPPPRGVVGRAAIEWVLDQAKVDGRRTHELWTRGDAWIVAPVTGAVILDRVVEVDATRTPTIDGATSALGAELAGAIGTSPNVFSHAARLMGGHLDNEVTTRGPLLEVLRDLYRPHEDPGAKVGWRVTVGEGIYAIADWTAPGTKARPPFVPTIEVEGGVRPFRAANGNIVPVAAGERPHPSYTPADEVIVTREDGSRYFVYSADPPRRPPLSVPPPPYPFPLGR